MLNITAIGYLGKDAIIKDINGKAVLNFSIAHTEKFKKQDGTLVEKTTWIECSHWEAEKLAPYLKQGTQVYVSGTPEARAWKNKDDEAQANLHVRVQKIDLLSSAKKDGAGSENKGENAEVKDRKAEAFGAANVSDGSDDLPF